MKKTKLLVFIIVLFLGLSQEIFMQENHELITDRPDVTESASVMPVNTFQIETGFMFQKQKITEYAVEYEKENLIFASTLCRYGIDDNIELRFGGEYFQGKTTAGFEKSTIKGLNGFFAGTKIQFVKDKDIVNNFAVIFEFALPFGNEKLRPDKFEPAVVLAFEKTLGRTISLGMNVGASEIKSVNEYVINYSLSVGFSINDRWNAFTEYFADSSNKVLPKHNLHFGFTYLQKENIQVDFSLGSSILSDETDFFGQVGFSIRLPE